MTRLLLALALLLGAAVPADASVSFGTGGTGLSIGGVGVGGGTFSGRVVITGSHATNMLDVTNTSATSGSTAATFLQSGGGIGVSIQRSTAGTALRIGDNSTLTNWIATAAGATTQASTLTVSAGGGTITSTGTGIALVASNTGAPTGGVAASIQRTNAGTAMQIGDNVTLTNFTVTAAGAGSFASTLGVTGLATLTAGFNASAASTITASGGTALVTTGTAQIAADFTRTTAGNVLRVLDTDGATVRLVLTNAGNITHSGALAIAGTGTGGTITLTSPSTGTTAIVANATGPSTSSLFEVQ